MNKACSAISDFKIIRPKHHSTQESTLDWIVSAHAKAESIRRKIDVQSNEIQEFTETLRSKLLHVGCKPDTISMRGHEIDDFLHQDWNGMSIYRLEEGSQGVGMRRRQEVHREIVDALFEKYYPEGAEAPKDLIHVSCTGYASPSGGQKIASLRHWKGKTDVTHLYHMGCYAALPAIRIARGLSSHSNAKVDVVHTELCGLHMNPSLHEPDQLVAQSLFADGFIKYCVSNEEEISKAGSPYLKIRAVHEQIIPDSTHVMEWLLSDWGFQFVLSKEIPALISRRLDEYVRILCEKAELNDVNEVLASAIFAAHPGGPKILQFIQKALGLKDSQLKYSREILKNHGNMSSATVPHIWDAICRDPSVPSNTKVISVAFGPGLTIAGALLETK